MKIAFLGDVHSDLRIIHEFIRTHPYIDAVVQVGDLGVFFSNTAAKKDKDWKRFKEEVKTTLKIKKRFKKPVYFCKGNHEDWDYLKSPALKHLNINYMPNGSTLKLGATTLAFIGGVYSPKKFKWPAEALYGKNRRFFVEEEIQKIYDYEEPIDILVSHIGAKGLTPPHRKGSVQELRDLVEKVKPKWYIHGHHHYNYYNSENGIEIQGLGFLPHSEKSYKIMEL